MKIYSEQGDTRNSQDFFVDNIHIGTAYLDTEQMLWIIDVEVDNKKGNALVRKRLYRPTIEDLEIAVSKYIKSL